MSPLPYNRDETREQITQLSALRQIKRDRLNILQRQLAAAGALDTPAHIQNEIEQLDKELLDLNRKILSLTTGDADLRFLEQQGEPGSDSLTPVSIVPQSVNERLIAMMAMIQRQEYQMRQGFQAVHTLVNGAIEQTGRDDAALHARLAAETTARETWQDQERNARRFRQREVTRAMWAVSIGLVLLFILVVAYITLDVVREMVLQQAGGNA